MIISIRIMKKYNPPKIERRWQNKWYKSNLFKAQDNSKKEKFYLLDEFPYPSGDGLHVGHCRPYIGLDVIARKRRMQGFNVLYPMGWDAFGLPTENYAIKKGVHPSLVTKKNTTNFKKQMNNLGFSFDWSREINTTDPAYYKWTQWIFIKLFENRLAYKAKIAINWCPSCKTGLANEEVVNGSCERCGAKVEKREKEQWMIKITKYADRLIKDLDLVNYPERVKTQQKEWIGRSEGININYKIKNLDKIISVFTTRPDTNFGATFLVVAPDSKFVKDNLESFPEKEKVQIYIKESLLKSDIDRTALDKKKTGVFTGLYAINNLNNKEMPIYVGDFVLGHFGTGCVVGVPGHDKRDFEFAQSIDLEIIRVVVGKDGDKSEIKEINQVQEEQGTMINSGFLDGKNIHNATKIIMDYIVKNGWGKKTVNYKLRDWIFSRQHYWGEPIPMIFCKKCDWQTVLEKDLPIELPKVKKYQPTDTGESPLSTITKFVNTKCPKCKGSAKRETDTMPNWAGSNWYYLAYAMLGNQKSKIKNQKYDWNEKNINYWMPVDWYNGGMEHTTLHLLYSRFIYKFLWNIGAVPKEIGNEPYKKRTSHGMILGEGGIKMSKSRGNVINPDDIIKQYGADTLRVYEMFMGPFEQMIPWDSKNIIGCRRFLEKVYNLLQNSNLKSSTFAKASADKQNENFKLKILLNKTIKKVGEDIEEMKFNTAVSTLMTFVNEWNLSEAGLGKKNLQEFLIILSPFAPHLTEELWNTAGFPGLCSQQKWPKYDEKLIKEEKVLIIVQINGRVRDKIEVTAGINQKEVEKIVTQSEKIKPWTNGKEVHKIIFIQDKLINIVLGDTLKTIGKM